MSNNNQNNGNMKYFYLPIANFIGIFMLAMFVMITRDFNERALEKVEQLELQVQNQEKMINFLVTSDKNASKSDTIVININKK